MGYLAIVLGNGVGDLVKIVIASEFQSAPLEKWGRQVKKPPGKEILC